MALPEVRGKDDARRSFLGLPAEPARISPERARDLAPKAWHQQAPKRLTADFDRGELPGLP